MATSGSTDFALDARDIVTTAFRKAKIIAAGETPTSDELQDGLQDLNLLLKTWSAKEHLWIVSEGTQALTAGTASYPITGARRMVSVRRQTAQIDTPLSQFSRQEYYDLPQKLGQSVPNSWFFDPQTSVRTLYIWPTASAAVAANTTLNFTYLRVIEDVDALENDPDVPQEWLEALIFSLAWRLALSYGSDLAATLKAQADALVTDLNGQDQDSASVFFQPARQ